MTQQHTFWGEHAELIRTDRGSRATRRDSRRLQRGVHVDPAADLSPVDRIRAAAMRAGDGAVVAGTSAAVLHGTQYIEFDDVEMIRDLKGQGRRFEQVRILRTDQLADADVQMFGEVAVTTPVRTAYDLGRRGPDWLALGRLDDLAHVTDLDLAALWEYIRDHPRSRGIRQIRGLVTHIDPNAESPGESWLRLLMTKSGLPRPESQVEVLGPNGQPIARLDLCYRLLKIDIEYDGIEFHTSDADRASNAERDRLLRALGWEIIRITGEMMAADPEKVIATIEEIRAIRERRFAR